MSLSPKLELDSLETHSEFEPTFIKANILKDYTVGNVALNIGPICQ